MKQTMTVHEALGWGRAVFEEGGMGRAEQEPLWLLSFAVRGHTRNPGNICFEMNRRLTQIQEERYRLSVHSRKRRTPLAYILGSQDFFGMPFSVGPSVLIPRPETEILVRESVSVLRFRGHPRVLDVGTGSGVIAVSLAKFLPGAIITAVDLSAEAVRIAAENARVHGVEDRISFREGNLFEPLKKNERFDLIVSNPPYVKTEEIPSLQPEVLCEPRTALDGGADGLDVVRPLVREGREFMKEGGRMGIEAGTGHARKVKEWMERNGFSELRVIPDDAGIERVIFGKIEDGRLHGDR